MTLSNFLSKTECGKLNRVCSKKGLKEVRDVCLVNKVMNKDTLDRLKFSFSDRIGDE